MAAAVSSPSSSPVRWWRTAFLTVRDETLTTPLRTPIPELLHHSIFSHSHTLLFAAPDLPPQEVTSDLLFVMELVTAKPHGGEDLTPTFTHITHLIHDISHRISLVINSASWTLLIDFFNKMLRYFIGSSSRVMSTYQRKCSMAEEVLLVKFLLRIIESSHAELSSFSNLILNQSLVLEVGKRMPVRGYGCLWEIQTLAFTMVGEAISRVGLSFPLDIWRSTIEVFRKVMDGLVAKSQLMEDAFMSRFNLSLLHCLHLTLADRKCYLSDHHTCSVIGQKEKEPSLACLKLGLEDSKKTNRTPYRPPHLRQRDNSNMKQSEAWGSQSLSDHESSANEFALSDSDYSDSDGSIKDTDNIQKSKVRVAAIVCIQSSCHCCLLSFSILSFSSQCILYLIQHETHSRLMASLLKILMLLISSTPVVTVFTSLQERMKNGFTFKSDHTGLLVNFVEATKKSGVLSLFRFSEKVSNATICFEALQALRAVSHNYPSIMFSCWEQISTIVYGVLRAATHEVPTGSWKGNTGNFVGFIGEKVITATIKVNDKLLDAPFISDCIRMKKISSVPLYEPENSENTLDEPTSCQSGTEQWCEAIQKHMPLILHHASAVVRAASVTCFAGITSSVYFSFSKEKQDFILSSCVRAAVNDVPSVRSAACRALCKFYDFSRVLIICYRLDPLAEILDEFVHAVEINTRDPLVSVFFYLSSYPEISKLFILLTECALRLTKDGDKGSGESFKIYQIFKYRSGSDRTLDNNGSTIKTTKPDKIPSSNYREGSQRDVLISCHPASLGDSRWLEQVVQALISCVTTGNVKIQWNVCHALSNLFLNETLRLQDMDWYSFESCVGMDTMFLFPV
ncbi:hypothetical protein D8674_012173 [Pyrus ussuriensis x Pyrus communis]|uniref:DUF4042 domain-containing protein n=1 Tax=Pyrus ussuriensis x Pyrus communis TaxID=2448454 RepID=A0A5N5G0T3_9ROSA|nr:hypothetical protein D8674_012173 [Pyrus ussuriensis x Pyrus communis]